MWNTFAIYIQSVGNKKGRCSLILLSEGRDILLYKYLCDIL